MSWDLWLLLIYLALAIGVSFLCSLTEAVLLTLTPSDAEVLDRKGKRVGKTLRKMKQEIDRPLAAILTLNTISHTVGAAGVGAQSAIVFENVPIGIVSGVLTILILVVSEIIPKTIGATYARPLVGPSIAAISGMIWLTWPIVVALNALSRLLRGSSDHESAMSRDEIEAIAAMARQGGTLRDDEHAIITNMLKLTERRVEDVMTPRTVVSMVPAEATAREAIDLPGVDRFSRLPVTGENQDDIRGVVLKQDLYKAVLRGDEGQQVETMLRGLRPVPEQASLAQVLQQFAKTGHHIFLVVDEYGGTAGVVTLEDVLEQILGAEIVDETDLVADMRQLAEPHRPRRQGRARDRRHED